MARPTGGGETHPIMGCDGAGDDLNSVVVWYTLKGVAELFDLDSLDGDEPFEIDAQAAHLFKHPHLGVDDVLDVWASDPLFYPAKPPAHWLMVAEVGGRVLVGPIAPSRSGDRARCWPIGCYDATSGLATTYRRDRDDY